MIIQATWLELELSVRWTGRSSSTGLLASVRYFKTPTQYPDMGDYKGRTRLSPPASYPSTMGYHHIWRFLCTQAPCPCIRKLSISPLDSDHMDQQAFLVPLPWIQNLVATLRNVNNRHLNLALLLIIRVIWMFKHRVIHLKLMTHKLYASSYIKIITCRLYSNSITQLYW